MKLLNKQTNKALTKGIDDSKLILHSTTSACYVESLKGLGHAILGNFSTDQMVIELTKI